MLVKSIILAALLLVPVSAMASKREVVLEPTHKLICAFPDQVISFRRDVYKFATYDAGIFAVRTLPIELETPYNDWDTFIGVTGCRIERIEKD